MAGGPNFYVGEGGRRKRPRGLPVRHQDSLVSGLVKYAYLELDEQGRPWFRGTGGYGGYRTEELAYCGVKKDHKAPNPECNCGFWVPRTEKGKIARPRGSVELEVEIGGRIIKMPRGYRAQWQRVLSVTLSSTCGVGSHYGRNGCAGPARWLGVQAGAGYGSSDRLTVCCAVHSRRAKHLIGMPVTWLRAELQTEIRPSQVRDEPTRSEEDRIKTVDLVALQQYPVSNIQNYVTFPPDPHEGDIFRVCLDVTSKMTYEFEYASNNGWQVWRIYHPMLEPWGFGAPPEAV